VVTLLLLVYVVLRIIAGISGEWYLWTPENIPSGNYSLKIRDPNNTSNPPDDPESNFSLAFPISGGLVTSAPSQTPAQSPLTPSPTDPAATSTVTPAPSSSSQLKGLSSTGKTIIGVVTATSIIVSLLCLGLWLRNIKQKKARGNHPLRTMSTDHANMSEHQNYPVLTPNKTHFAFVTQELPADPRSGRSPVYETKFDARTLDHYRQGRVKPPTSSSSSDEESLVKQISYPKAAVIQFRTRE
jgi:hypothetical protein